MAIEKILSVVNELSLYENAIPDDISYWNLRNTLDHGSFSSKNKFSKMSCEVQRCHYDFFGYISDIRKESEHNLFNRYIKYEQDIKSPKPSRFYSLCERAGVVSVGASIVGLLFFDHPEFYSLLPIPIGLGLAYISKIPSFKNEAKILGLGDMLSELKSHAEPYFRALDNFTQAIPERFYGGKDIDSTYPASSNEMKHFNTLSNMWIDLNVLCHEQKSSMSSIKKDYARISLEKEKKHINRTKVKGRVLVG